MQDQKWVFESIESTANPSKVSETATPREPGYWRDLGNRKERRAAAAKRRKAA